MEKIVLVDGNNLLFRSYYATAYSGNLMKNSKGIPTNGVYGLANMMNKILEEEKPTYLLVAFDMGKNFRKEKNPTYKAGRSETPQDLKSQFPLAKKLLSAMGIKYYEIEPYEADDIIGTMANRCNNNKDFNATIISSDKDLLQLITDEVEVKLLKTKDYIRYNETNFKEDWGFEPIRMIDYKALAGDSSDNIPGVKGCGDKTAINLLSKYDTIEDIYDHIDDIKGAIKQKLINDKESAFKSKELATIYTNVPVELTFDDIKYNGYNIQDLIEVYKELEFYSLIRKLDIKDTKKDEYKCINIMDVEQIEDTDTYSIYIECDSENYHRSNIIGIGISTKNNNYYASEIMINEVIDKLKDKVIFTYDNKKNIVLLNKYNLELNNVVFDSMIASYLLEMNVKDDIANLMYIEGYEVNFYKDSLKKGFNYIDISKKARYIYDTKDNLEKKLKDEDMYKLFTDIEMPLIKVLSSMEISGIVVKKEILNDLGVDVKKRLEYLDKSIQEQCGVEFNVSSPRQLGVVLFEKLKLPYGKKTGTYYKTDQDTLKKLVSYHPVIKDILEYRNLSKLSGTYIDGLIPYIMEDNKIHTIYKQNITRTGRLSSVDPNMQNIPVKNEVERKIKKAFLPSNDILMSLDYSQIELRLLAHISKSQELISAFNRGEDIHARVAADIYNKDIKDVTKEERKTAKAVIFGIVYGISGFGLGENLGLSFKSAKVFIDKYYDLYPGVKKYMDDIVSEAKDKGYVRTLFKRKRTIDELQNKNYMIRQQGERIALNTPIQGTCADIIKLAMVKIYDEFKRLNLKSKMILQVHDELIFDCVKEEEEIVRNTVKNIMENVIKLDVPIIVSCDIGTDWYETK